MPIEQPVLSQDPGQFAKDVAAETRRLALEPALWVPAVTVSLAADGLMATLAWPFRDGLLPPPERTITVMAIVILAKAWFSLTLCQIGLAIARGQHAGVLNNWVPVTTALRIGLVVCVVFVPIALGTLLLVVPGLYLLALWSQVALVLLDHRARWFEAAEHSGALTAGYKLPILLLWMIVLGATALSGAFAHNLGASPADGLVGTGLAWIGRAAGSTIGAALAASMYYQLSLRAPWNPEAVPATADPPRVTAPDAARP